MTWAFRLAQVPSAAHLLSRLRAVVVQLPVPDGRGQRAAVGGDPRRTTSSRSSPVATATGLPPDRFRHDHRVVRQGCAHGLRRSCPRRISSRRSTATRGTTRSPSPRSRICHASSTWPWPDLVLPATRVGLRAGHRRWCPMPGPEDGDRQACYGFTVRNWKSWLLAMGLASNWMSRPPSAVLPP